MNSPSSFFKAEQLTPSSSPISLSLDDSRNVNNNSNSFANLLASPTRFKLSDSSSNNNGYNSNGHSIFPTSLSKLNTYNRGRSTDKSMRDNNKELRPVSPIRFNNNNNNNKESTSNSKPIMFKQEFISNYSSLPLLSTLLRTTSTNNTKPTNKQPQNNINPLLDDNLPRLSIKETLQRIQQYNNNNKSTTTTTTTQPNKNTNIPIKPIPIPTQTTIPQQQQHSTYDIIDLNNNTTKDNDDMLLAPPLELQVRKTIPNNNNNNNNNERIVSNTSTLYSNDNVEQNFMTDNNGFVKYMKNKKINNNPVNNVNRYSFISSTSTDYDNFDLYEQQQPQPPQRRNISGGNHNHHHHITDINEFTTRLEANKLDVKIKQLEIEIDELKLQNMKLINSINHHSTTKQSQNYFNEEDENELLIFDELDENIQLKNKVKLLERKIDSYKKTITSKSKVRRNLSVSTKNSNNSQQHNRISRLSTQELQKFEETTDPSSSFSSIYSDDENPLSQQNNNGSKILTNNNKNLRNDEPDTLLLNECDYEADIDDEHMIHLPKRRGFNLNIPIEK